ncbi:hypothetical protein QUF54_05185 [Candidatus Marithioploca araucensis]|uniref:Uncharacterized protein n=1 Tax=Candidatus Marithioploca araucensis TaxID=70273 RepID=A0ABT7VT37_9GAMM|nr:hypothetical protein [Candidatus Marithioploca araucensis]
MQEPSDKVIDTLNKTIGLKICDLPYSQVIAEAIQQTWTILLTALLLVKLLSLNPF